MKKAAAALLFIAALCLAVGAVEVNGQITHPNPSYEFTPLTPRVGDTVTFDASTFLQHWSESKIVSLDWNFRDGTTKKGTVVTHVFTQPGEYWVELTATDDRGLSASSALKVSVGEQTPITIYEILSTDVVYIGQQVIISGNLTFNGGGVPGETVSFFTKVYLDEAPWVPIGSATTDADGSYRFSWSTLKSSGYQVKATWAGNATYPSTSLTRNLYVVSYGDFITGFDSNSTITDLSYNMTTRLLQFNAEGPTGTSGFVNVTLTKDPAFDPERLVVLFDNQPIQYTVDSAAQAWILFFTYHHSVHHVIVDFTGVAAGQSNVDFSPTPTADSLGNEDQNPLNVPFEASTLLFLVIAVAVASVALLVYLKRRPARVISQ